MLLYLLNIKFVFGSCVTAEQKSNMGRETSLEKVAKCHK